MTNAQRRSVRELRREGYGYKKIANELGISVNTVRAFCTRNDIKRSTSDKQFCKECGKEVPQTPGRRRRLFCSDMCRRKYWSYHRNEMNGANEFVCARCGKKFRVYGTTTRKYCSIDCYIQARFYDEDEPEEDQDIVSDKPSEKVAM